MRKQEMEGTVKKANNKNNNKEESTMRNQVLEYIKKATMEELVELEKAVGKALMERRMEEVKARKEEAAQKKEEKKVEESKKEEVKKEEKKEQKVEVKKVEEQKVEDAPDSTWKMKDIRDWVAAHGYKAKATKKDVLLARLAEEMKVTARVKEERAKKTDGDQMKNNYKVVEQIEKTDKVESLNEKDAKVVTKEQVKVEKKADQKVDIEELRNKARKLFPEHRSIDKCNEETLKRMIDRYESLSIDTKIMIDEDTFDYRPAKVADILWENGEDDLVEFLGELDHAGLVRQIIEVEGYKTVKASATVEQLRKGLMTIARKTVDARKAA